MKTIGTLVGVLFILLGITGIVRPGEIISLGYRLDTPVGLYGAAALRIVIGLVLVAVASASRAPIALRIMGGIIILLGVATAFISVGRAREALNWFTAQRPAFIRLPFAVMTMIGLFLISVLNSKRRDAYA